jgi:hypothetical protein
MFHFDHLVGRLLLWLLLNGRGFPFGMLLGQTGHHIAVVVADQGQRSVRAILRDGRNGSIEVEAPLWVGPMIDSGHTHIQKVIGNLHRIESYGELFLGLAVMLIDAVMAPFVVSCIHDFIPPFSTFMICVGTLITPWGLLVVETRVMRVRELEGELRIGYRPYRNL